MKTWIRHPRTGEKFIADLGVKIRQKLVKQADGKIHRILELVEIRQRHRVEPHQKA